LKIIFIKILYNNVKEKKERSIKIFMNYYQGYPYPAYQQNPIPTAAPSLQGKVVDSEEMVKASEVTFGGYGIFPKADLSAIYIKT
jgi:hypothetical protein